MIPVAHTSHASTIEVLPDGSLAAAWFSGEHEEASDLAIVFSVLKGESGQNRKLFQSETGMRTKTQFYSMISYIKLCICTTPKQKPKAEKARQQSGTSKAAILEKRGQNRLYGIRNQVAFQGTESYRIRSMAA